MPLIVPTDAARRRRFAAWAIGPWVLLLLAAVGCVQYLRHGEYVYLAVAALVIVVSAGSILRQAWSRPVMQVLAILLAAWSLITAVLMLLQWGDFEIARQHARAQPQVGEMALWLIARAQRTWQVGIALKLLSVPALLWLAWKLAQPAVRVQFRSRRR